MRNRILAFIVIVALALYSGTAYADEPEEESSMLSEDQIESSEDIIITFQKDEISLSIGSSYKAVYECSDESISIRWSSDDASIASVEQDGTIRANGSGRCIIKAEYSDYYGNLKSSEIRVTVYSVLTESIKLNLSKKTIDKGKAFNLGIDEILPEDADMKDVIWKSTDEKVAVVSKSGRVRGIGGGNCYIYAYSKDGSGAKARCRVYVREYQRNPKYYQVKSKIKLPGGGYSLSTRNIGLKVIKVNKKLLGRNYDRYTSATRNAVISFQKRNGLKATGIVGKKTWLKMGYSEKSWYSLGTYISPRKVTYESKRKDYIDAMVDTAEKYRKEGTRFKVGCAGKPGTYADCSGLIFQCLYAAGINPDKNIVDHALAKYEYTSTYLADDPKLGRSVSYKERKRGDLIFYGKGYCGTVCHVALYVGDGKIIDAWPGIGVTKRNVRFSSGYQVVKVVRVFE